MVREARGGTDSVPFEYDYSREVLDITQSSVLYDLNRVK